MRYRQAPQIVFEELGYNQDRKKARGVWSTAQGAALSTRLMEGVPCLPKVLP